MTALGPLLNELRPVFDLEAWAAARHDPATIRRYFRVNRWAYRRFHSKLDALHVGLSTGPEFRQEDVEEQPRRISRLLTGQPGESVLELGMGRGMNSIWLARRFPEARFTGLDLTPLHLKLARQAAEGLGNFEVREGDFHDLSGIAEESLDLAFVIEALCYSPRPGDVLAAIARRLKPGGHFAVFDAYLGHAPRDEAEELASTLLTRGMAVERFTVYDAFRDLAGPAGLEIAEEADYTAAAIPTARRFGRQARRFLARPRMARLAARLSPLLAGNVISGHLMGPLLESRLATYWYTVFRRPG